MKPELRVALLGVGFMGKAHSNAWCQAGHFYDLPYTIRRRLICSQNEAAAGEMAARWEWEEATSDWRSAVDRKDIDAVDICLPNHLHAPVAIAAAEAGKIVLCEKPLALSVDEARAMVNAARKVRTLVWYNYRRVPAVAFARQLIDQGRLGAIFHYNATYYQQWGADLTRTATWRMDPARAGSGVADDLLTHSIDLALHLNGGITETIATSRTFAPGRAVNDAVAVLANFANGSLGRFEASRFGIGCRNHNAFDIHGSHGMLRFNLEDLNRLKFLDAKAPPAEQGSSDLLVTDMSHPVFPNFWRPGHIIGYEHTFIATLAEFLIALSREEEFHADFEDGLRVQEVLDAVLRSAQTREWAKVAAVN